MEPSDRKLLENVARLSEENNEMLHKMQRIMRWARFARIIYWIILIGGAIGAYYYIQPFVDNIFETYADLAGQVNGFSEMLKR